MDDEDRKSRINPIKKPNQPKYCQRYETLEINIIIDPQLKKKITFRYKKNVFTEF